MRKFFFLLSITLFGISPASAQDTPKEDKISEAELLKAADEIANQVAELRGLEIKTKVKRGIKKREELRDTLLVKLAEEVTDDELTAEADVMKTFGMIPKDLDYKKMLLDVLTEQIAGFYDQKEKELYVMHGIPLSLQKPAMAHELYHAIQDQHFDILAMQKPFETTENADFSFARSALIEGDATVLMFDYQMRGQLPAGQSIADIGMVKDMLTNLDFDQLAAMESMLGGSPSPNQPSLKDSALSKAPLVFRESLIFPYFAGMRFVIQVKQGRSWKEFDAVYDNPPVSTEQILHPQKYFDQEEPVVVSFNTPKSMSKYKKVIDTVWGEFEWKLYFKSQGIDGKTAHTGWGGDRVVGLRSEDNFISVGALVMDSVNDAQEMYDEMVGALGKRYSGEPLQETGKFGQSTCYLGKEGTRAYVERWGDVVLLIEGAPSKIVDGKETDATLYALRDEIWKTFKRTPFREAYNAKMKEVTARQK